MSVINPNQPYTYSRYSELQIDPIDLCEYFGYKLTIVTDLGLSTQLSPLAETLAKLNDLTELQNRLRQVSTRLISRNEQAKREMLIAPVIAYAAELANGLIRIEYEVDVSHQLKGVVDYLLSVENLSQLVVIEAKRDDLDYGFTQLMAELIALDQWERSPSVEVQPTLLGGVTTGGIWQFVLLDRSAKSVRQEVTSFRVPEELDTIVRRLAKALEVPQT